VISQVVVGLIFSWFYAPTSACSTQADRMADRDRVAVLADERFVTYGIIAAGLWPQIAYVHDPVPDRPEQRRPRTDRGRAAGQRAKGWRMLWYVILPQLRPATFIAVVVTVIGALRSFRPGVDHDRRRALRVSQVLSYFMYEQALSEYGYRMGYGAAIAVVLFAIMMVFISGFIVEDVARRKGTADVPDPHPANLARRADASTKVPCPWR
jgi:multiple sugar transport system permease protein